MGAGRRILPYNHLRRVFLPTFAVPETGYTGVVQSQRVETWEGNPRASFRHLEVYRVGIRPAAGGRTISQERSKPTVGKGGGHEVCL